MAWQSLPGKPRGGESGCRRREGKSKPNEVTEVGDRRDTVKEEWGRKQAQQPLASSPLLSFLLSSIHVTPSSTHSPSTSVLYCIASTVSATLLILHQCMHVLFSPLLRRSISIPETPDVHSCEATKRSSPITITTKRTTTRRAYRRANHRYDSYDHYS